MSWWCPTDRKGERLPSLCWWKYELGAGLEWQWWGHHIKGDDEVEINFLGRKRNCCRSRVTDLPRVARWRTWRTKISIQTYLRLRPITCPPITWEQGHRLMGVFGLVALSWELNSSVFGEPWMERRAETPFSKWSFQCCLQPDWGWSWSEIASQDDSGNDATGLRGSRCQTLIVRKGLRDRCEEWLQLRWEESPKLEKYKTYLRRVSRFIWL